MVRLARPLGDIADQFVLVRLDRITGRDLTVFEFDYDLTWAAFFLDADEKIYGRYGIRDASSSDGRLSLAGLRRALDTALASHRKGTGIVSPKRTPQRAEDYPAAKRLRRGECIHCHQIYEFRREQRQGAGLWSREERWVYPLPENIGLTLNREREDEVQSVRTGSPAERAGLRAGDLLTTLNDLPIASAADVQYALHRAPAKGKVVAVWKRGDAVAKAALELSEGWRWTNLTWRPSMLDVLPSIGIFGDSLSAEEKKTLGLSAKQMAFRQDRPVPDDVLAIGVREGDIILGLDGKTTEMTVTDFLAHVRRNYLIGDRVTLNILRQGKRHDLPLTLR